LVVLDSTHPDVLWPLISSGLGDVAVIVSSKSGGTVETDSQRRVLEAAFIAQNIDPAKRIIVVTDPGSPLAKSSAARGYAVFDGNPNIGGRFSALSAFGLVPGTLIGADTRGLLKDAVAAWALCVEDSAENPGLILGAALAAQSHQRTKVLLRSFPDHPGLGDWVEQLVAESTGKDGVSLLPVVGSSLRTARDALSVGPIGSASDIELAGTLGANFMVWQWATAFACHLLGVNAFDQPNVESTKVATRALLSSGATNSISGASLPGGEVWQSLPAAKPASDWDDLVERLLSQVGENQYLALCVFGGPNASSRWSGVVRTLEGATDRPVTLGVGPRYLHSTGQLHKGGRPEGVFLVVCEKPSRTVVIPGADFDCGTLLLAQAQGDATVLAQTGQPVFVAWTNTQADTENLMAALEKSG
jgi:glucose-6-phosphate isomerase